MTRSSRFAVLTISMAAVCTLSACQPKSDNSEIIAENTTTQSVADAPVAQTDTDKLAANNDSENDAANSTDNNSVDMIKLTEDYNRAIRRMSDEIDIGIGYKDPDTAFAKSTLGLYRGAVNIAGQQLKYGSDAQLQQLAQDIIDMHSEKIGTMNKWLASHPDIANPKPNTEAMQQAYADIISSMNYRIRLGIDALDADLAFARAMLPHQLATVAIAKEQLRYGTDTEMRQLAVQITKEQPLFIARLQAWLAYHNDTSTDISFDTQNIEKDAFDKDDQDGSTVTSTTTDTDVANTDITNTDPANSSGNEANE